MRICPLCNTQNQEKQKICSNCGYIIEKDNLGISGFSQNNNLIGVTLDNKYLIEEFIGTGGMGSVYKGRQTYLDKIVAIKIMNKSNMEDEKSIAMFYREARLAARLNHPNSISIFDFGKTTDGLLYMVMEFLNGDSLASVIAREETIDLVRACIIIRQVCLALEAAHKIGLVHRDLKPDNIFLQKVGDNKEHVTVLDFGIAKQISGENGDVTLTKPGMVWGTPLYMSPEQATGKELDKRTDLYSLGVVFYELLCGRPPFVSENPTEILISHVNEIPPKPSEQVEGLQIPTSLELIVLWAMEKNKEDRLASATHFRKVIESWLAVVGDTVNENLCHICGSKIEDGTDFCPVCLHKLNPEENEFGQNLKDLKKIIKEESEERKESSYSSDPIKVSTSNIQILADFNLEASPDTEGVMVDNNIRSEELSKLKDQLVQGKNIFLTGEKGIGRTTLVKNYHSIYFKTAPPLKTLYIKDFINDYPLEIFRKYAEEIIGKEVIFNLVKKHFTDTEERKRLEELFTSEFIPTHPDSWFLETLRSFEKLTGIFIKNHQHQLLITDENFKNNKNKEFYKFLSEIYHKEKNSNLIIKTEVLEKEDIFKGWECIEVQKIPEEKMERICLEVIEEEELPKINKFFKQVKGNPFYLKQALDLYQENNLPKQISNRKELPEIRINWLPTRAKEIAQIVSIFPIGYLDRDTICRILDIDDNAVESSLKILQSKGILYSFRKKYHFRHSIWEKIVKENIPIAVKREFLHNCIRFHKKGKMKFPLSVYGNYLEEIKKYEEAFEVFYNLGVKNKLYGFLKNSIYFLGKAFNLSRIQLLQIPKPDYQHFIPLIKVIRKLTFLLQNEGQLSTSLALIKEIKTVISNNEQALMELLLIEMELLINDGAGKNTDHLVQEYIHLAKQHGVPGKFYLLLLKIECFKRNSSKIKIILYNFVKNKYDKKLQIDFFNELANYYFGGDEQAKALKWWNTALYLSLELPEKRYELENQLYRFHMETGDLKTAEDYLFAMLSDNFDNNNKLEVARTYLTLGQLALQQKDEKKSRIYFEKAREISQKLNWEEGLMISTI
ncbi:MAG: protein kinase domain-containing protein [Myxococcota bacterium]